MGYTTGGKGSSAGMPIRDHDVTGVFCTSGSVGEFTLEERWYADKKTQTGADRNAATGD